MKALVLIIILAVIGYFAYTQFFKPLSEEEQLVKGLDKQFNLATRQFVGAGRISGGTGLDTTSDAEIAVNKIKKVRKELESIKDTLTEEKAIARAEKLDAKIKNFYEKNDLD